MFLSSLESKLASNLDKKNVKFYPITYLFTHFKTALNIYVYKMIYSNAGVEMWDDVIFYPQTLADTAMQNNI